MQWSEMDLHVLYSKRNDPGIWNYTAFVIAATGLRKSEKRRK